MKHNTWKMKTLFFVGYMLMYVLHASAQTNFLNSQYILPASDSFAVADGLAFGFHINSAKEKEVGDKGNFSRYNIEFAVTNTTSEAKIFLYNQGWQVLNDVSPNIIRFDITNATGARLTSKMVELQITACNLLAYVQEQNNVLSKDKKFVQVGYWIRPGETIKTSAIIIVPLNDLPQVTATLYPNNAKNIGNASFINNYPPPPPNSAYFNGFMRIRNNVNNTYVNIETGMLTSSSINMDWWSAHWQIIPVPGTNYVNIQNRWKNNYLTVDNGNLGLDNNYMNNSSQWILEPSQTPGTYHIRNVVTGTYLCIASNQLKLANNPNAVATCDWLFEKL
jgi:hypothetical protein